MKKITLHGELHANPCLNCGACCAFFRVSFYWGETDPAQGGQVPVELTENVTEYYCAMRGTNQLSRRCIALEGKPGGPTRCTIYEQRPSPCRDFGVQWQGGQMSIRPGDLERCNHARAAWNMPPISVPVHHVSPWRQTPVHKHLTRR
ncbi:MAG TPA: YkgJ family cysteine cluster protein [Anaerolineaceae bacterium]|jgi:Fe-S-cluster containining protein|nr:YkgJ family cysteine cluster protein [Longilinea sp.]HNZ13159.1 YkgJ family cysteine cluster protein [Anaerolineaceae bacterium]HOG78964.1 YkgJ family cysteine cluster protein [Anaerolineaceae bacterium]HQF61967.1 YkgJ family cysteine cluster protein [Anaerolineaceae bacterium]HQH84988.1 YkgJ family cysteine cluster protein [Anaerolineaceae bacterium]